MSRRNIFAAGLVFILLVNYLPYGIETIVHGLFDGSGLGTFFIPLTPVLIGIPLVFRYSHRKITGCFFGWVDNFDFCIYVLLPSRSELSDIINSHIMLGGTRCFNVDRPTRRNFYSLNETEMSHVLIQSLLAYL